ncbi:hypothetical protein ES705_43352 [subsurface metagenome]
MIILCLVFILLSLYDFTIFIATVLPNVLWIKEVCEANFGIVKRSLLAAVVYRKREKSSKECYTLLIWTSKLKVCEESAKDTNLIFLEETKNSNY